MLSLLVLVLLQVQMAWTQTPVCNRYYGPPGTTRCIRLIGYLNQYQWATCLTNSYIKQKSGHRHSCVDSSATYCWYQCMVEVYHQNYGFVRSGCKCTPGEVIGSSLPQSCFSPSGDSCNWYRNCLRKKYSCQDSSNAYAVRYAEKFCELYDDRRSFFSAEGQKWVDAVRKCLQVDLVPLIRPWVTPSCYNLRQKALASHVPCYLNPDQNVTSVCDLKCTDYLRVFWFIKGSFIKMDTAWESMKSLWNIETRCKRNSRITQCLKDQGAVEGMMKFTKITVKKTQQRVDLSRFADKVGSSIANILKWNSTLMDWIAYTARVPFGDDVEVTMVLADKNALGVVISPISTVNLTSTVHEFASAIEEGKLSLQVDGYKVLVKSMALCSDASCARTQSKQIVANDRPKNGAARFFHGKFGLLGVLSFSFLFQPFFY